MKNELILVDTNDKEIGYADKEEVHEKALLHRAFSVFIYTLKENEPYMLIHKRALNKYHSGGLWTNSCCSHPGKDESIEAAVSRRLKEELGISADVKELYSFTYYHRFTANCAEFEYDHVFIGRYDETDIPYSHDEIAEIRWISLKDLEKSIMSEPDDYTPWFMIAAPRVIEAIWREAKK